MRRSPSGLTEVDGHTKINSLIPAITHRYYIIQSLLLFLFFYHKEALDMMPSF